MRSDVVVLPPPPLSQHLDLFERVEDLAIEKLVSQSGIERLDVAVLPGTARLNEERSRPRVHPGEIALAAVEEAIAQKDAVAVGATLVSLSNHSLISRLADPPPPPD